MVILLSILGVLALVAFLLLRSWLSDAGTTGIMDAPRDDDATTSLACRPQYGLQPGGSASAHSNNQLLWQNMARKLTENEPLIPDVISPQTSCTFEGAHSWLAINRASRASAVVDAMPDDPGNSIFFGGTEDFALSAAVASATGSAAAGYAAGGSLAGAMSGEACCLSDSSLNQGSHFEWDSGSFSDHSHSDFDSFSSSYSGNSFGFD